MAFQNNDRSKPPQGNLQQYPPALLTPILSWKLGLKLVLNGPDDGVMKDVEPIGYFPGVSQRLTC